MRVSESICLCLSRGRSESNVQKPEEKVKGSDEERNGFAMIQR